MKIAYPVSVILLVVSLSIAQAHAAVPVVGPNVDIIPAADRQQSETTVAVDPHNPNVIVAGAQDYNLQKGSPPTGHRWNGYYRSADGGVTWSDHFLPGFPGDNSPEGKASPLRSYDLTSDPVLAFDGAGNAYYAGLGVNSTTRRSVAFVAKYVHDGADYSSVTVIRGTGFADKPWITADTTGGPHDGNVYLVFDGPKTRFTRSTDGGSTFSLPTEVPGAGLSAGVAVDSIGNIFVSMDHSGYGESRLTIIVSKSTDGGVSFQGPIKVASVSPLPSAFPGNLFRTFTIPQIAADDKGVYVVWDDYGRGASDVLFAKSNDGGATWSVPHEVNDKPTGQHFFPTITSSGGGIISVAWYDSRLGQQSNGTITGLDVFFAVSTDAGANFSPNLRVTSISFDPNSVRTVDFNRSGGPFIGDYIQVAASSNVVHAVWTDNRSACDLRDPVLGCLDQDAFTATITV